MPKTFRWTAYHFSADNIQQHVSAGYYNFGVFYSLGHTWET